MLSAGTHDGRQKRAVRRLGGARGLVAEFEAAQRGFQTNANANSNGERRVNANGERRANVNGEERERKCERKRQTNGGGSAAEQTKTTDAELEEAAAIGDSEQGVEDLEHEGSYIDGRTANFECDRRRQYATPCGGGVGLQC
ncbi:uncharacterized protein DS421_14g460740 [Arachis hypogaea]|nr:uncharacterized protein DS421_14g460740 [Arachis hypogaea]